MTYNISGGALLPAETKLTDNALTDVLGPFLTSTVVLSIVCTEIGNTTPNLTIAKNKGATTIYYRFAKAMTAKETVTFEVPIVLKTGWTLQVQSSNASGQVDVDVSYLAPDKTSHGAWGGPN